MAANTSSHPLIDPGPRDPLAALLSAWRLWLLGALIGALLGWGAYQLFPSDYRARATVVVDVNAEAAWQYFPDREMFQLIGRESERLELLAWSDGVLQSVAATTEGLEVSDLRGQVLRLSQPSDGGWRMYADYPDAATAEALASNWATSFVEAARAAVEVSPEIERARAELSALAQQNIPVDDPRVIELMQAIHFLAEHSQGISIYTEMYVSEGAGLPLQRTPSLATYLLVGSLIGALALGLLTLLGMLPLLPKKQ